MAHNHNPVRRCLHVNLTVISHFLHGRLQGCHGILRCHFRTSPVGSYLGLAKDRPVRGYAVVHHVKNHEQAGSGQGACNGKHPFPFDMHPAQVHILRYPKIPRLSMDMPSFKLVIDHGKRSKIHYRYQDGPDKQHHQFKPCAHSRQYGHCSIAFHKQRHHHRGHHHDHGVKQDQEQDKYQVQRQQKAHGPGPFPSKDLHTAPETILEILLFYHTGKKHQHGGNADEDQEHHHQHQAHPGNRAVNNLRHDKIDGFYPGKQTEQQKTVHHQEISKGQGQQLPVPFLTLIHCLIHRAL